MQVCEPKILNNLIDQTYAAIPGKGAHQALTTLRGYLKHHDAVYCLKMDIRKFFPSIDKDVMMAKLRRRFKDLDVLWLFSKIIYEYPFSGIPIGNYTSQYLANLYLSDLDHALKEKMHAKYYLRYMDDMIVLGWSKAWLHRVRKFIEKTIAPWGLELKGNWQVFPVEDRGVDFVGYRTFRYFTLLRTGTKTRLKRAMRQLEAKLGTGADLDCHDAGCLSSYRGVLAWCDSRRLARKTTYRILRLMEAKTWMKSPQHQTTSHANTRPSAVRPSRSIAPE